MANQLKIIGDCYKKFGLKHTSKSTACLPHSIRFFKKHILTPKENSEISNASFYGGTLIHIIVQESLTKGMKVAEKLRLKKYDPVLKKHVWFVEKKMPPHSK